MKELTLIRQYASQKSFPRSVHHKIWIIIIMDFCNYSERMMVYLYMQNYESPLSSFSYRKKIFSRFNAKLFANYTRNFRKLKRNYWYKNIQNENFYICSPKPLGKIHPKFKLKGIHLYSRGESNCIIVILIFTILNNFFLFKNN